MWAIGQNGRQSLSRRLSGRLVGGCLIGLGLMGLLASGEAQARGRGRTRHSFNTAAATRSPAPIAPVLAAADDDASPVTPAAGGEVLDNAAVIKLSQAGLTEPVVAAMIRSTPGHYDISTPALVTLGQAGVPGGAVAAMIKVQRSAEGAVVKPDSPDPAQPHPAGVYVLAHWLPQEKMLAIKPITTTRTTSGSVLGYAFAGGLIPVSFSAIVPQPHAAMLAGEKRPTFYFYTGSATGSQRLTTVWGAAPSPDEVRLVRLATTRNGREVKIGSFNISGAKLGVDARDALPFDQKEVSPGVVAVQPEVDLAPGEYGFIQTVGGVGIGAAQASTSSARVFDFAIADSAMVSAGIVSHESATGKAVQAQGRNGSGMVPIYIDYRSTKAPKPPKLPNSSPSLYPK